jgi:hypothetical protein
MRDIKWADISIPEREAFFDKILQMKMDAVNEVRKEYEEKTKEYENMIRELEISNKLLTDKIENLTLRIRK